MVNHDGLLVQMGLTQLHTFSVQYQYPQAGTIECTKTDEHGLKSSFSDYKVHNTKLWVSLSQVPYFHSHMHQCLAAQCQEKINVSQKDKILARKTFAREEEKLPLQAASKFT